MHSFIKILTFRSFCLLMIVSLIPLSGCFEFLSDKKEIIGNAVIVNNFKDKQPLEGVLIDVEFTRDEGNSYEVISQSETDENGFFKIDTSIKYGTLNIDSWTNAKVYANSDYTDTLGEFSFMYPDQTYSYKTIFLDTFSLEHHIWVIPRIKNIGAIDADKISIYFHNVDVADLNFESITYEGPITEGQTFTPVKIKMSLNIQHWITYGTRDLAHATLMKDATKIGFGYFNLEEARHTSEGDTLFIDFEMR